MRRPTIALLLAGIAFVAAFAQSGQVRAQDDAFPAVFGASERFSSDIAPFTNWTEVLRRARSEIGTAKGVCPPGVATGCAPAEWNAVLQELAGKSLSEKVETVNARMNGHRYVPSLRNWGTVSYWETPFEFLRRDGQCQDYAIAKFLLLRAAGVPNDLMRVAIVHDTVSRLDHAVLVVNVGGEAMVLDNQVPQVVAAERVHRYVPYYSINETGWWQHIAISVAASLQATHPAAQRKG